MKEISEYYIQEILQHYNYSKYQIIYDSDIEGYNKNTFYTKILYKNNLLFLMEIESTELIGFITSTCIYY